MRVLLVKTGFIHEKNLLGFRAMCDYAKAELVETTQFEFLEEPWDLVWIPIGFVHPGRFVAARRIILGPHNFVFPERYWVGANLKDERAAYNCLSPWNRDVYAKFGGVGGLDLVCLPYPVDTRRFTPMPNKKYDCFLYVKLRKTEDVKYAMRTLDQLGLTYKIIHYKSYKEEEYMDLLDTCTFGVWVGRHESQGFALQEALSCDVPLVVWDVDCMGEEWQAGDKQVYNGDQAELKATAAPFWDARCGLLVQRDSLKEGVRFMKKNWPVYRPRQFVLENLGVEACARRWFNV
jgi:hypothetical protein